MKKLLFLCLACLISSLSQAQQLTEKDFQGNWKLKEYVASGATLDVATGQVTASKELAENAHAVVVEQIVSSLKQAAEPLRTAYFTVNGNNVSQSMMDQLQVGTYTLGEKNGRQVMMARFDDGSTADIYVAIIDNQLHIAKIRSGQVSEFIYTREQATIN
jgi:hypothetical protein